MSSRLITTVVSAAAVAVVVDLTDMALDKAGLQDSRYRIPRKILKSGAGAAAGLLVRKFLPVSDAAS